MNLQQKLIDWGLSENEAKIYLSAMELGPSPVQKISDHSKIHRVSTYNFIKSLISKGLMSSYQDGKKTMFIASEPERLINFIDQQKRSLEDKEKEIAQTLPQLKSFFNVGNKPVVRFYEGFEGAIAMNDEMIQENDVFIENIYNRDQIIANIPAELLKKLSDKRKNKNIKTISIFSYSKDDFKSDALNERFVINDPKFPISCDITFYKNKVRFISFSGGITGTVIENKEITDTLRSIYYLALETVKNKKRE